MKKLLLVCALVLGSSALFAQNPTKFGRVNYTDVIQTMPEMKQVELDFEKAQKEYEDQIEAIQVELNNKLNDFQKLPTTTSEAIRQDKARDIQNLQERLQQFYQTAQEQLNKTQMDLMAPLEARANEAIKKICKSSGIIVAFFANGSAAYIDEAATIDITEKVKAELKTLPAASAAKK